MERDGVRWRCAYLQVVFIGLAAEPGSFKNIEAPVDGNPVEYVYLGALGCEDEGGGQTDSRGPA